MPYLILGLALLVASIFGVRAFLGADPKMLAKLLRVSGIAVAVAIVLILIIAERFALAVPFLALAMMLLRRSPLRGVGGMGGFAGAGGYGAAGAGGTPGSSKASRQAKQQSEVHTRWLSMALRHASGEIDGTVRRGRFQGRRLSDLDLTALLELLAECRADDVQSGTLLETYLDRIHGADWRQQFEAQQRAAEEQSADAGARGGSRMSPAEARDILGVGPDATATEIREAHRRLMKKLHPDHGGSTYLASRVNAAKDTLLGA